MTVVLKSRTVSMNVTIWTRPNPHPPNRNNSTALSYQENTFENHIFPPSSRHFALDPGAIVHDDVKDA